MIYKDIIVRVPKILIQDKPKKKDFLLLFLYNFNMKDMQNI